MGVIGNLGGRYTRIRNVSVAVANSGTGPNNMVVYTCPDNTETRISCPRLFNSTQQLTNATWKIVDGDTNMTFPLSAARTFGISASWRADAFKPQDITVGDYNSSTGLVQMPGVELTTPTASPTTDQSFIFSRFDPMTGEIILRENDILRLDVAAFTSGSSTTTIVIAVKEETRA